MLLALFREVFCVKGLCFFFILIMPRKYLHHPETFCYVCDEMTFKFLEFLPNPLRNDMNYILSVYNLGTSYLLCNGFKASHGMGKCFASNAVQLSHCLERNK